MIRLNEEDTNTAFFNHFAKSGMLPVNAKCLLYVMCSLLGYDLTFLLE